MFSAVFADLGAGAVDLTLSAGSGSGTFTRNTVAWTKLSTGLWASVASGTARSCYLGADTTVGAYGGYFAEAAGTQLVTPTASIRDMTDASWVKVTTTVAKTATGIDGGANSASTLTATGATSTVLQTLSAAASSRTFSAFVRRKTGTGTVFIQQGATQVDITASINSSTYTRVSVTASILNSAFGFQINTSGDAIEVDFNQFEAGTDATSPMASAGVSRSQDSLQYVAAGNISDAVGTCVVTATSPYSQQAQVVTPSSGSSFVIAKFTGATTSSAAMFDGTQNPHTANTTSWAANVKVASSWGGTTMGICLNAGTVVSAAYGGSFGFSGVNIMVGHTGSGQQNGTIKNLLIYNFQATNAQLQTFTT